MVIVNGDGRRRAGWWCDGVGLRRWRRGGDAMTSCSNSGPVAKLGYGYHIIPVCPYVDTQLILVRRPDRSVKMKKIRLAVVNPFAVAGSQR